MFKLYTVPSYSLPTSQFDDHMDEFNLEDAIEQLEGDFSFHFRVHPTTNYIFFGDLDNYPHSIDNFIEILFTFLKDKYILEFDKDQDFKYTKNDGKKGSYHYSIPKWNLSTEALKEIHTELLKKYPTEFIVKLNKKETYCVDTTIYSEHWFRCPNQSKGDSAKSGIHKIIFGNMEDFIIDYIPTNSINIDNIINIPNDVHVQPILNQQVSIIPRNIRNIPDNPIQNAVVQNNNINNINQDNKELLLSYAIGKPELYKLLFDQCFAPIRFSTYDNWMKVGMAIKNTIANENDAIQLYIYYSSKGSNYDGQDNATRKYKSYKIKNNGYGLGTIYKMAIEDNKNNAIRILGANTLQFQATDFCRFITAMAGNRFFYKVVENTYTLYCYNGKYWQSNDILLRSFISGELYELLKDMLINIFWNSRPSEFQNYKNKLDKLNTLTFKKEIIETYKEFNFDSDIEFDEKWWLFGFKNIVYDMNLCKFREYEYDDYISITTGYDWREPTEEELTTMRTFFKCIMPVESERETFLLILATGIDGRCIEKFIIYNGFGGNGKGVIDDIMLSMLGTYGFLANNSLLFDTSKMGSNPEKANLHKKRYVIFREPPERAKFANSAIKEFTGGGTISARGHYESKTEKELNSTMICECNNKPSFSETITQADIRRIIDIYFRCIFTEDDTLVDNTNYIYKADPFYKTKEFQKQHRYALFKILTEYHKKFLHENKSILVIADSIKLRTSQYLENACDLVTWFQFEYIQDEPDVQEVSYLSIGDIHKHFIESDIYQNMSRKDSINYSKIKFFELIRKNLFFKKYYVENYNSQKRLLKGWYRENVMDM